MQGSYILASRGVQYLMQVFLQGLVPGLAHLHPDQNFAEKDESLNENEFATHMLRHK